jgi:Peptidase family S41
MTLVRHTETPRSRRSGGRKKAAAPRRKVRRAKAPAAPLPESADYVARADVAVRPILEASSPLSVFLAQAGTLTPDQRRLFVDQAIVLLEGFYVHLPLKRAMHAVDPLQRLRLLRKRLPDVSSDARFHAEMTSIFTSVRDLHTNYLLPAPFSGVVASLPFRVEACVESNKRSYVVGGVATGFQHATFVPGVKLRYWNGTPIERAVENAADRHAGSNMDARHARGLAGLTQRPLRIVAPPDEEWVVIGYTALDGTELDIRLDWLVTGLPPNGDASDGTGRAAAMGLDIETDLIQRTRRILFAPYTQAQRERLEAAADPLDVVTGADTIMPGVFSAREVTVGNKKFGYIRIFTFVAPNNDPDAFVGEFVRLAELLPQEGLIVDVRDNGGGHINAGEQLLQVLTPRTIEPERLQFINTALTLRLCELHAPSPFPGFDLAPWLASIRRAVETGATFSASAPISSPDKCNAIGQRYHGPVVLITSARCYSTTDIFAAGFQDHGIGPILGVDGNTGAGGANVWEHGLLRQLFDVPAGPPAASPFKELPNGGNMRVAIRRTLRVGVQAGTELEDLGVVPDQRHAVTRNDVLNGNVDLIAKAAALLAGMPVRRLSVKVTPKPGDKLAVEVDARGVDRLDFYLDGRPQRSEPASAQTNPVAIELKRNGSTTLLVQGFEQGKPVAARRVAV